MTGTNATPVFYTGLANFSCFKIPTLFETNRGTLLAISEARGGECWDWDETSIVSRRSTDGGATWGNVTVVVPGVSGGHMVAGNVGIVQDRTTGVVWLPFNRGNYHSYLSQSSDDGASWCEPVRMPSAEHGSWTWVGFGPPAGLQLASGRMVIPTYASDALIYDNGILASFAFMVYSDDHGATWSRTSPISNGAGPLLTGVLGNECQVAEVEPDHVVVNARGLFGARLVARSRDGGLSWTPFAAVPSLPMPLMGCEGSMIALRRSSSNSSRRQVAALLFTGPATTTVSRANMTAWRSDNGGVGWVKVKELDYQSGGVGYSSLVQLHTGRVVVLYGRSDASEVIFVPGSIVMQEVLAATTATGGAAAGISAESISAVPSPLPLMASCSQAWQNEGTRTTAAEQPFIFALVVLAAVLAWVAAVRHCVHGCCTGCCYAGRRGAGAGCRRCLPSSCAMSSKYVKGRDTATSSSATQTRRYSKGIRAHVASVARIVVCTGASVLLGIGSLGGATMVMFRFDDSFRWQHQALNSLALLLSAALLFYALLRRERLLIKQKRATNRVMLTSGSAVPNGDTGSAATSVTRAVGNEAQRATLSEVVPLNSNAATMDINI